MYSKMHFATLKIKLLENYVLFISKIVK